MDDRRMKTFIIHILFFILIGNNSDCKQIVTGERKLPKVPRICQKLPQFTKSCLQKRNKRCQKVPSIVKSCQNALESFQNVANACLNKVSKVEIAQETVQKRSKMIENKCKKDLRRQKTKYEEEELEFYRETNEKSRRITHLKEKNWTDKKTCLVKENILQQSLEKSQHVKKGISKIIFQFNRYLHYVKLRQALLCVIKCAKIQIWSGNFPAAFLLFFKANLRQYKHN